MHLRKLTEDESFFIVFNYLFQDLYKRLEFAGPVVNLRRMPVTSAG